MRSHDQDVQQYIRETSVRLPPHMAGLIEATQTTLYPAMAPSPEQGQFLAFLMKSIGAQRAIEISVFTGLGRCGW